MEMSYYHRLGKFKILNEFCPLLVSLLLFIFFRAIKKKKNCREHHNFAKAINAGCFVIAVFIDSL